MCRQMASFAGIEVVDARVPSERVLIAAVRSGPVQYRALSRASTFPSRLTPEDSESGGFALPALGVRCLIPVLRTLGDGHRIKCAQEVGQRVQNSRAASPAANFVLKECKWVYILLVEFTDLSLPHSPLLCHVVPRTRAFLEPRSR